MKWTQTVMGWMKHPLKRQMIEFCVLTTIGMACTVWAVSMDWRPTVLMLACWWGENLLRRRWGG